jgi:hypothetical protein
MLVAWQINSLHTTVSGNSSKTFSSITFSDNTKHFVTLVASCALDNDKCIVTIGFPDIEAARVTFLKVLSTPTVFRSFAGLFMLFLDLSFGRVAGELRPLHGPMQCQIFILRSCVLAATHVLKTWRIPYCRTYAVFSHIFNRNDKAGIAHVFPPQNWRF